MAIIAKAHKLLTKEGLVMLDGHMSPWDMFLTARNVRMEFNPKKILMPIAGSFFYAPIFKEFIAWWAKQYDIEFHPVYRRVEYEPTNMGMRIFCSFYPKELTPEVREKENANYIEQTFNYAKKPGHIIIVSPYGGAIFFGQKVKYGVRKLIESGAELMLSLTRWSWPKLGFVTSYAEYDSELLSAYRDIMRK